MDLLTYDELRVIEREERSNNQLTPLTDEFIDRFNEYANDKQKVLDKSDDNIIAGKVKDRTRIELTNAKNSYNNIMDCRARKVFNQAFTDIKMSAENDFSGFLSNEKELYNNLKRLISDYLTSLNKAKVKKADSFFAFSDDNILVRFVKEFPEFMWNGKTIGPFKTQDIANLPKDVIKLLLNKEVVKVVSNENN